jgi:hypothetical protein
VYHTLARSSKTQVICWQAIKKPYPGNASAVGGYSVHLRTKMAKFANPELATILDGWRTPAVDRRLRLA